MKNKFKNFFKNISGNEEHSKQEDFNPYKMYDATDEIPSNEENDIETIERDIASKRVQILVPKIFNDVKHLADELKTNKIALVDLSQLSKEDKRRVIDFISGVIYINDGSQKKLEKEIFKIIIRN